jgi:hypothetical protein
VNSVAKAFLAPFFSFFFSKIPPGDFVALAVTAFAWFEGWIVWGYFFVQAHARRHRSSGCIGVELACIHAACGGDGLELVPGEKGPGV